MQPQRLHSPHSRWNSFQNDPAANAFLGSVPSIVMVMFILFWILSFEKVVLRFREPRRHRRSNWRNAGASLEAEDKLHREHFQESQRARSLLADAAPNL